MGQKAFLFTLIIAALTLGCLQTEEKIPNVNVPPEYKEIKNPVTANQASLDEGKRLYSVYCKTCHAITGEGNGLRVRGQAAANLLRYVPHRTDGELYYIISKGITINNETVMLPYEGFLMEEELWHLVNYVRTLP